MYSDESQPSEAGQVGDASKYSTSMGSDLTRRSFLHGCGSSAGGSLLAAALESAPAGSGCAIPPARDKTIGIQVGAVSFVDEGVEAVLDILQERGRVNTLYLATFTYGRGLAGRQVPGQPFPDHGVQSSVYNNCGGRAEFGSKRGGPFAQVFRDATGQSCGCRTRCPRLRSLTSEVIERRG